MYKRQAQPYVSAQITTFGGELKSLDGRVARLMVQRHELTQVVAKILAGLEVRDLTITDPPIEEVIGQVFQEGAV